LLAILLAHALAAAVAPLLVARIGRLAFYPLALVPLGSLIWVLARWPGDGPGIRVDIPWVPELAMDIALRFDSLAAIMGVIVLGVGALVLIYCASYFRHRDGHTEPRLPSFAAELVAFSGAMFGLVVSDNLLLLYIFWELTTVLSFLLVGHYAERLASRRAAVQALLVTTAGGLAMLVGVIVLGHVGGSFLLSDLVANPPSGMAANVGLVLVLIGALSKSAIVPLHFWLPGAMAAPTPVSAYLHAAAMVKAGIYLLARMSPGFAEAAPWRPVVLVLGIATMILAGWRALREYDLKLILAFGTVSQLGFLVVLTGTGDPDILLAGLVMLCAHALFKAALFMVVGIVDHTVGTRDIRKLAWLGNRQQALAVIAGIAAASMAGVPLTLGFVGKELAFATVLHSQVLGSAAPWVLAGIVIGSMFTITYSMRFMWGAFARKGLPEPSARVRDMHAPAPAFLVAPALLAMTSIAAGVLPDWLNWALGSYANPVDAHVAIWEGFGVPLLLTAIAFAVGILAFFSRGRLRRARLAVNPLGNADRGYDAVLRGADVLSQRLTALTQRGSIPFTQATILVTLVTLPTIVLTLGARDQAHLKLWDSPLQGVIGLLMLAAAIGATIMRNRLAAVLLVGITGYGTGTIFALHGAPDLALTQFLVETLTLVIFVLVLRALPAESDVKQANRFRLPRAALAIAVGCTVTTLGVYAMAARRDRPIADLLPQAAYQRGHGANTVNVLLVDIRAWDTLGEISVLLVAATGVASLMFRHRRFGRAPRVGDEPLARRPSTDAAGQPDVVVASGIWLRGSELRDPKHRSLVLEVATRLIFPLVMVLSFYFFFAGHNVPGGGFAGGLTAGLALVLRYLAGGRYELGETLPFDAGKILGLGLAFSGGTALASMLLGAPVLSSATIQFDMLGFGHIKIVTAIFFDLGVYLVVVGLVLDVLRSLGARLDVELEESPRARGGVRAS